MFTQLKGDGPERGGSAMSWPQPQEMAVIGIAGPALAAKIWTEFAPFDPPHM